MWKKKVDWLHKKEIKTEKQTEDPEPPVFILRLVWISKDFRLYENQSEVNVQQFIDNIKVRNQILFIGYLHTTHHTTE